MVGKDGWTINAQVRKETIHYIENDKSLCGRFELWWDRDPLDNYIAERPEFLDLKCKVCLRLLEKRSKE